MEKTIGWLWRWGVAGTFLVAGVMKIWNFSRGEWATGDFTVAIQGYELVESPWLVMILAIYLPWLEVVAGVGLFFRSLALGAAAVALGMSGVFLVAVGSAWWRGLIIGCGCFGEDSGPIAPEDWGWKIFGNVVLVGATGGLLLWERRRARWER